MAAAQGIQIRVIGPMGAGGAEPEEGTGFALPAGDARQLIGTFQGHMSQKRQGPLQMLVDAPDVPVSVVNLYRYYGSRAAVAHVLRAGPAGGVAALAGVFVLLPGVDRDADEAALAAVESSRDATGKPFPLNPKIYASLRDDVRPLVALLFFNSEALRDASLRLLAVCLAEAFFGMLRKEGGTKHPRR